MFNLVNNRPRCTKNVRYDDDEDDTICLWVIFLTYLLYSVFTHVTNSEMREVEFRIMIRRIFGRCYVVDTLTRLTYDTDTLM